jgi:3-oxosteroid 1-dehydrogenase
MACVFPGKTPESAFTAGLLKEGASLDELAKEIGVDAKELESISHFNEMVARGNDDDFGRGKSFYDQHFGDPTIKPIPILGTLEVGPFYAIQIWPGDLGTEGSLPTDEYTRVLRKNSK